MNERLLKFLREHLIIESDLKKQPLIVITKNKQQIKFENFVFVGEIENLFISVFNLTDYNKAKHEFVMHRFNMKLEEGRYNGFIDKICFNGKQHTVKNYLFVGFKENMFLQSLNIIDKQVVEDLFCEYMNITCKPKKGL